MTDLADLPESWTVWSDGEDGRLVLVYRPDVFDAESFPAPCLPTLYVTRGRRNDRRPGTDPTTVGDWFVTLTLEPEVEVPGDRRYDARTDAVAAAVELARDFDDGEVDYRGAYQLEREAYLEELDALTGREA